MSLPTISAPTILSSKPYAACSALIDISFHFAVLSQIPTARRLISLLNKHHPLHHSRTVELKPLWLCWAATNAWPEGERGKADSDAEIDAMAAKWAEQWWYRNDGVLGSAMSDAEKLRRVLAVVADPHRAGTEAGVIVSPTGALVHANFPVSTAGGRTQAVDLRIKIEAEGGESEGLPSLEALLKEAVNEDRGLRTLAQSKRVWEVVKTGEVEKAVGVDARELQELGRLAEETFRRRFEEGRQRPVVLAMEEMARRISENTQRNERARKQWLEWWLPEDENAEMPSLLRAPASEDVITALEESLAIKLPEDFKAFLRISNGFGESWDGHWLDAPLFSAEEVRWFDDDDDYMEDIMLDLIECQVHFFADYETWPKVGRAIHIGREDAKCIWLIPPVTVSKVRDAYLALIDGDESSGDLQREITAAIGSFCGSVEAFKECEWCVVELKRTELKGHRSFEAYMAEKLRSSEI
jgi:hypothetical protein